MPSIPLHPSSASRTAASNPLPGLLQTPSGLAIIELQGTIHFPAPDDGDTERDSKRARIGNSTAQTHDKSSTTPIGRLVFPLYDPNAPAEDQSWMKRAYFYVGNHQRMTGEVKKLPKPVAVIQRRAAVGHSIDNEAFENTTGQEKEELEIVEIVKYKIIFASRPEPVSATEGNC